VPRNDDGEFELILGNRQLMSVFFIVVILLGVFFAMGYIVGRNSSPVGTPEVASRTPETKSADVDTSSSTKRETAREAAREATPPAEAPMPTIGKLAADVMLSPRQRVPCRPPVPVASVAQYPCFPTKHGVTSALPKAAAPHGQLRLPNCSDR